MPNLRHLALHTADPQATAAFYKKAFDMIEVGRTNSPLAEGIYLSDGTLNMAVLRYRSRELAEKYGGSSSLGISHFGFWADDIEETRRRLREAGAQYVDTRDHATTTTGFFEEKWQGPDQTVLDITDKGWVGALPPGQETDKGGPKLRHLALHTADAEGTADFYKRAFDMHEAGRNPTEFWDSIYLSDGTLNVTVLHFKSPEVAIKFTGSSALGLSHIGFLVQSQRETARRLQEAGAEHMSLAANEQGALIHSEDKWKGPDGVVFDITDTGWTGAKPLK
jgi:methylmalonyl-CoA/ethylmalonyl-CoA epimerase